MGQFDDAPDVYWHCYFGKDPKQPRTYAMVHDLTKQQLLDRVITPWRARQPLLVGSEVIRDHDAMKAMKIVQTPQPSKVYEEAKSRRLGEAGILTFAGIGFAAFHEGVDFTHELLASTLTAKAPSASRTSHEKYLKDPTNETISRGHSGVVCKNLKTAFDSLGYRRYWGHPYDFDEELEHVVREFQQARRHRNQDGRVGPSTRALVIDELLASDFDWSRMQSVSEYDVALSFASEDRDHAEALAACLTTRGVRVFYDRYEQAELWGKDLYVHLHSIYSERARFCVMLVSTHYAAKVWTTHERRAAQEHALQAVDHEYILPIRLDGTKVPGLASTIGYVDIGTGIDRICELLVRKLRV